MKSLFTKTGKSIFVILIYLPLKFLKYIETNRKMCDTFDHNLMALSVFEIKQA